MSNEHYLNNPLIHADRRLGRARSRWVQQFDCSDIAPLIICRGPIRKEAIDVFSEMGISHYGILLSEKDSIVYRNALAPELRSMADPNRIHRVPDYTGSNKGEREQRIRQIIQIARDNGYNAVFAGYGFMAEDEAMVAAMEAAGLNFIGPCSRTVHDAGLKDEAKRTALRVGVSVTPGVDNATALTLLKRYPDVQSLEALAKEHSLELPPGVFTSDTPLADLADRVLAASYARGVDLYTVDELCATLTEVVAGMAEKYPDNRVRLKAISGGGGKGQRILGIGETGRTAELVREILNEVKTTGVGDNKNVLVELNIETTRHQEIQVIGNGDWCLSMGGRDCSLQMHEQKLLEVSVTDESLRAAQARAQEAGRTEEARILEQDVRILAEMEDEAARFGAAVGLDSVSTFECIVDRDQHFFMEMNTRIQVEHRVTELCYALRFNNPEDPEDGFTVNSLVEAMVLLAAHGERLPRPLRVARYSDSVEARLNATNQALQPSAGGVIEFWSDPFPGEIRDDQGISLHNPDTDVFMKYTLAGAYDSNIALLLTVGDTRLDVYQRMAESIRRTRMRGKDLATNLDFHYGLVNWFIGQNINARPTTRFIVPYLTAVGELRERASNIDLVHAWQRTVEHSINGLDDDSALELRAVMDLKQTLLLRPLEVMFAQPHLFSGWLSINRDSYTLIEGRVSWNSNPTALIAELYHYLNMDAGVAAPAARVIWDHDDQILRAAESFYATLHERTSVDDWLALRTLLEDETAPASFSEAEWQSVRAAHRGYQAGAEMLALLPTLAEDTHFFALSVNPDLSIAIPDALLEPSHQAQMAKVLVPPPAASADEILAQSGGMFYARETPDSEPYVRAGAHFDAGDPLYIVEVMKMFNKVYAPFAGTVDDVLVEDDGVIISKGQALFRITPDERVVIESATDIAARKRRVTDEFLARII
ncbi:MAG: biotin/lipoyl-containing protein [Chromatocurvus sp.]